MKGFLHRLITIGTPHFGADLAEILYEHRNDWYCYDPITKAILFPNGCQYNTSYYEFMPLKTISSERLSPPSPIDRGAIQAMDSEDSIAYRHMCPTNVPSYAIAGSWIPCAFNGHTLMERFYRNLLNDPTFNLDIDGFGGNFIGNNDLQVDLTSQTGGLNSSFRQLTDSGTNIDSIPKESSVYPNTVHSSNWIFGNAGVFSELNSDRIQQDIVALLSSSDEKFADNIGIGSMCISP